MLWFKFSFGAKIIFKTGSIFIFFRCLFITIIQGSNLKKLLSGLSATIEEKMVAKCKNAVAR